MGRRGPKPKFRDTSVPLGLEGKPEPPEDLDPLARAAWDRITNLLGLMGTLCHTDADALYVYARTFSRWERAERDLDRTGTTLVDKYGRARANPATAVAKDCRATLIRLMCELRLTPSARVGLNLPEDLDRPDELLKERREWDELLSID